jgi:hypothetical protein
VDHPFSRRDELITLASYGEITPDAAEAEAAANGLEPFARSPDPSAFNPEAEPRWTMPMAVAWIAWRDMPLVREQCAGFRAESEHWIFSRWRGPAEDGKTFLEHAGWLLKTLSPPSTTQLRFFEIGMSGGDEMPATKQMSIRDAEAALWGALSEGHLTAVARNEEGRPTDVPAREWLFLKLFEENDRDALKYEALDRRVPFTEVALKRDDVLRLWPRPVPAVERETWPIEPYMLEPVHRPGSAGFVPLCSALQWIMARGGTHPVMMDDKDEWTRAVDTLWPLISGGDIELIGLHRSQALTGRIPPEALTLVRVLAPLQASIEDMVLESPSHVDCTPYVDAEHWTKDFNDRLYETGKPGATWTHLQVRKSDLLARWPRPAAKIKAEADCRRWLIEQMHNSPERRPKPKPAYLAEATKLFKPLGLRQFQRAWADALAQTGLESWARGGRPRTAKLNQRTNRN